MKDTILFRDNKFWIDGVEVINPELIDDLNWESENTLSWFYGMIELKSGNTFPLPENLSYEIACNYNCCTENGGCEHCHKPVIRLKLKDETFKDYNLNEMISELKNETPEAVVQKPDFELFWKRNGRTFKGVNAGDYFEKEDVEILFNKIQALQNENERLKEENSDYDEAIDDNSKTHQLKISNLEAQLVKAKELLLESSGFIPFYHFELSNEIKSVVFDK